MQRFNVSFFDNPNKRFNKQSSCQWFEMWWRPSDVIVIAFQYWEMHVWLICVLNVYFIIYDVVHCWVRTDLIKMISHCNIREFYIYIQDTSHRCMLWCGFDKNPSYLHKYDSTLCPFNVMLLNSAVCTTVVSIILLRITKTTHIAVYIYVYIYIYTHVKKLVYMNIQFHIRF